MSRDKLAETEDAWFNNDFGGAPSQRAHEPGARGAGLDGRTRTQLAALGAVVVVTFVAGLALGAFSSHASPEPTAAPAPIPATPTPAQQVALDTAAQWSGTALLSEDALFLSLDELLTERRAEAAPVPAGATTDPIADAGTPAEDPAADGKTEPVTAKAVEKAPVAKAPVAKAPVEKDPVEKAPVAKAPVAKAPIEKDPVAKAPVEKAPVDKAPEPVVVEKAPEPTAPPSANAKATAAGAIADAKAKAATKDWKGAVSAYTSALAASPGDAAALVGRGQAYFELKQGDLATKDLEAVLALNPTHATALLTLGSIAQDQGKKAAARDYYERYLKRYPTGRRAAEVHALLDAM